VPSSAEVDALDARHTSSQVHSRIDAIAWRDNSCVAAVMQRRTKENEENRGKMWRFFAANS
jgi:streptomycin 6-kinase